MVVRVLPGGIVPQGLRNQMANQAGLPLTTCAYVFIGKSRTYFSCLTNLTVIVPPYFTRKALCWIDCLTTCCRFSSSPAFTIGNLPRRVCNCIANISSGSA